MSLKASILKRPFKIFLYVVKPFIWLLKRRRWREKQSRIEIKSDYSFIAEGSKLTIELSDFLKDTGRDPRRYDK
jgi:hypothetical protein